MNYFQQDPSSCQSKVWQFSFLGVDGKVSLYSEYLGGWE